MKKGITAISATILVVIIIILLGTVSVNSYNSIQNANKLVFALEISEIQELVTKYQKNSADGTYPTTEKVYSINLSQITTTSVNQFENETKDSNGNVVVYEVDLDSIDITDTQYGNNSNEKDVYVVSKNTGRVYYLEGVKSSNKTYYTLTEDLIDIKERNEKTTENVTTLAKPVISTDGLVSNVLSDGSKEEYIANIKVTGDEIEVIKYEVGIISESDATTYFKSYGKTLDSDRIKLQGEVAITIYAENSQGQYDIEYVGYLPTT